MRINEKSAIKDNVNQLTLVVCYPATGNRVLQYKRLVSALIIADWNKLMNIDYWLIICPLESSEHDVDTTVYLQDSHRDSEIHIVMF